MSNPNDRRYKRLWPILTLLLLAVRSPLVSTEGSPPARAQQPEAAPNRPESAVRKPAWRWTVEERLAKLLDPEERAAWVREHMEKQKVAWHSILPLTTHFSISTLRPIPLET